MIYKIDRTLKTSTDIMPVYEMNHFLEDLRGSHRLHFPSLGACCQCNDLVAAGSKDNESENIPDFRDPFHTVLV